MLGTSVGFGAMNSVNGGDLAAAKRSSMFIMAFDENEVQIKVLERGPWSFDNCPFVGMYK